MAIEINPSVVITGDMKSDFFNTQNNKLSEIMTFLNFKNIINKPTKITAHISILLDPIKISDTMSSIYSDVLNVPVKNPIYFGYRLGMRIAYFVTSCSGRDRFR
jgi:hypothetical protein